MSQSLLSRRDRLEAYPTLRQGRGYFLMTPGTWCLATIMLSLCDDSFVFPTAHRLPASWPALP